MGSNVTFCECMHAVIRCRQWCLVWTLWSLSRRSHSRRWLPLRCWIATVILRHSKQFPEFWRPQSLPPRSNMMMSWPVPCSTRRVPSPSLWDCCSCSSGDSTPFVTVTRPPTWLRPSVYFGRQLWLTSVMLKLNYHCIVVWWRFYCWFWNIYIRH